MTFGSRLTGGLAWAGLTLVVGVPVVNMLWPESGVHNEALSASVEAKTVPVETAAAGDTGPEAKAIVTTVAERHTVAEPATGYTLRASPESAGAEPANAGDKASTTEVASSDSEESPVDRYLATGKTLPDYISDGGAKDAKAAEAAKAVRETATATSGPKVRMTSDSVTIFPEGAPEATVEPKSEGDQPSVGGASPGATQLANLDSGPASGAPLSASAPSNEPPIPMPVSMRPPTPPQAMKERTATISVGSESDYVAEPPADGAPSMVVVPVPPGEVKPLPAAPGAPIVTEEELRGWKTGTLADYLRSKGLLEQDSRSEGRVRVYRLPRPNGYVDNVPSDGQYYDEGDPGYPYAD